MEKYFLRHLIVALSIAVIGILFMWLGNGLIENIGSVLLVSGIYTIIDTMYLKQSLVDLVIQKVALDKAIDDAGLIKLDSILTNIKYKEFIENANCNIDIVHNYGRTWTTNNYDFVKECVLNKECKVRVVLLNPESEFVPALEKHYGYTEGSLKKLIIEMTEKWKVLYYEVENKKIACAKRKNSTYKNKKCGCLEIYYFNGQPTNSLYRIDNKIVVINSKTSKEKSVYLPYAIYENKGNNNLYQIYLKEIDAIIEEATKLELSGGK